MIMVLLVLTLKQNPRFDSSDDGYPTGSSSVTIVSDDTSDDAVKIELQLYYNHFALMYYQYHNY